jgi:tetratricopeptide (TPR) repeat protein
MRVITWGFIFLLGGIHVGWAQETTTEPQTAPAVVENSGSFDTAMKLYRQKRYREAVEEFEGVVAAEPKNAAAHYFLGYAHYILDHHQDALAAFAKAFEGDPAFDPKPYFRR